MHSAYRRCSLAALLLVAECLVSYAQQPGYKISGQVVHRADNRPVRGARVSIAAVTKRNQQVSAIAGPNGEFSFAAVPPGKYSLEVNDHGWRQQFDQFDEYSTAIAVGPGLDSEHILFLMSAPASISGSVLDDDNEPVGSATVYLFGNNMFMGRPQAGLKANAQTDSDGHFHLGHLSAGTYYVAVSGRPWYAQNSPAQSDLDVAFPLTYYAGGSTPESAAPIRLQEGSKAEIQLTLRAVPALHIALQDGDKQPEQNIQTSVTQIGPGGTMIDVPVMNTGSELAGIAPGNYVLSASLNGPNQSSSVGSGTVSLLTNSTLQVRELGHGATASISGKVLVEGTVPPGLAVWLGNNSNGNVTPGFVQADGSFNIADRAPGHYVLLLANTQQLYIRKVTASNAAYLNGELEVTAGAHIELTITAASGVTRVEGVAVKAKVPVASAMVLLFPHDLSHGPHIPRDQSDSDGTFSLQFAIPGRYTLVAIDNGHGLAYGDPKVMAPYLEHGQVIDVPVDKPVEVEVQARRR